MMPQMFEFILNGRPVRVAGVSPNTTLLEFLRARGLTGTKEGCAEGDCGACSVALIECGADGKATYRAVNSCLLPLCLVAGREVVTVEGIASAECGVRSAELEKLHPVQQKMVEHHGSQCGYCTPGFICSLFEGFYRDDLKTSNDLDEQLAGNLCRCTGYRPIRDAAIEAFACRRRGDEAQTEIENPKSKIRNELEPPHVGCHEDAFAARLKNTDAKLGVANYESGGEKFFRPASLAELFRLRKEIPDARLIAGATELGLEITKHFKKLPTLISVEAVAELKNIECDNDEWRIGAAVTLTEI